jgi:hypothetical protein
MRTTNNKGTDMSMYGECEICGEKKKIRSVRNKNACATCEHIWRAANVAPDLVLKTLTEAKGEDYLRRAGGAENPDQAEPQQHPSDAIIERIITTHQLASGTDIADFVENLVGDVAYLKARLDATKQVIATIRGQLNLDEEESIIETVAELQRKYNYAKSELHDSERVIELIAEKVGRVPGKTVIDAVEGLLRDRQQAVDIMYEVASEVGLGLGDIADMPQIVADLVTEMDIMRQAVDKPPVMLIEKRTVESAAAVPPEYASLHRVLIAALNQAATGKGKERHAKAGEPFEQQKICEITRRVGLGYPLGQAIKKAEESLGLGIDAGIRENLGAINYLAAAVLIMEERAAAIVPMDMAV